MLLHEYGDQSTYYFHHLHRQQQQQPDSPLAGLCTEAGRQQASSRAGNNDTMDVLGEPGDPPQLAVWRRLWQLAGAAYLNRQHRVLWRRILHGCVICGAFSAYIGRATPQQACDGNSVALHAGLEPGRLVLCLWHDLAPVFWGGGMVA